MNMKPDREKLRTLLTDTVTLLCRNTFEWNFQSHMCVQGVVGVTLDDKEVLLVHINRKVKSGCSADTTFDVEDANVCEEIMSDDLERLMRKRRSGEGKKKRRRSSREDLGSSGDSDPNQGSTFSTPQKVHSTNGIGSEEERKKKENHLLKVVLPAVEKLKAKGMDDSDCSEGSNHATTACSTSSTEERGDRRKSRKPLNINARRAKFENMESEEETVFEDSAEPVKIERESKTFEAGVWEERSQNLPMDEDSEGKFVILQPGDPKEDLHIDKDDHNAWMPGKKVRRSALSKSKPHKCEIKGCDKSFYHKTHLRRHERLSHNMLPARLRHLAHGGNSNNGANTRIPTPILQSPSFPNPPHPAASSLLHVMQQPDV